MKKLSTILCLCIAMFGCSPVWAHSIPSHLGTKVFIQEGRTPSIGTSSVLRAGSTCDTLQNTDAAGDNDTTTIYTWQTPASGYVSGNASISGFSISQAAEAFTAPSTGMHVTSAYALFGYSVIRPADSSQMITAYVYNNSGVSFQGNLLAPGSAIDSASVSLRSIAYDITGGFFTQFVFTHQPNLPATGFYISVVLPTTAGDTLVVITNRTSAAPGGSWIDLAGLGWSSIDSITGGTLGLDDYIVATVCGASVCPAITVTGVLINSTSAFALASGGTAPYHYTWSTIPAQNTDTATGLTAGSTYHVTATDANGCTGTNTITMQSSTVTSCDTLLNTDLAGDNDTTTIYTWQAPSSGYVSGNAAISGFSIGATAEAFTAPSTGMHVTSAYALFGYAVIRPTDSNQMITAYVYDNTGISYWGNPLAPGNALDSASVSLRSIATDITGGFYTQFVFTHQPTLPATGFYVAVSLPTTTGDTLVVITNRTSVSPGGSWIDIPTVGWSTIDSITGGTLAVDDYIVATVCGTTACPTITVTATQISGALHASATASGGTGPYHYIWSTVPAQYTDTATGLSVGSTYHVTATDANGCTGVGTVTITAITCPTITVTATQISGTHSAKASASGGATPYHYTWSTIPAQNTDTAAGLTVGTTYYVTVTDGNGCTGLGSVTIASTCPTISVGVTQISGTTSAYATASGGATPYHYVWNTAPIQTTDTATGMTVGSSYQVTVTDANGCTGLGSVTIQSTTCPTINVTATQISGTTSAYATASGGATPYHYTWSTSPTQSTDTATGLTVGTTYHVTATDANGCTGTATITIQSTSCPTITVTVTQVGSEAFASISGGTGPYTYSWSTSPGQSTDTATGLTVGATYTVTVTDANHCTGLGTVTILGIQAIGAGVADFGIYPNPSSGTFTASIHLLSASDISIAIMDIEGRRIYENAIKNVKDMDLPVDVGSVSQGIYIVTMSTATGTVNQRLVIK